MASVQLRKGSKIYHAFFKAWDSERSGWKRVAKSTLCEDKRAAQMVADGYERLALAAGPGSGVEEMELRRRAFETVRSVVELSGRTFSLRWHVFGDQWLEMRGRSVKPGTMRQYRSHVKSFGLWLTARGEESMAVGGISLEMAQAYYDSLREDGASTKTAKNHMVTLGQVMARAVAAKMAEENPFEMVERERGDGNEREPFTREELGMLMRTAAGLESEDLARDWRTMILLGLCLGARIGDCARMRMEWLEETDGVMILRWRPQKKTSVTGEGKMIRVPVLEPLRGWLLGLGWQEGPICPALYEVQPGYRDGLSAQFREIVERSGVAVKTMGVTGKRSKVFRDKSFHSLRHTLNSMMFAADVPQEWRMKVLDHESVGVNEGYTHTDVKEMARWLGKVDMGV